MRKIFDLARHIARAKVKRIPYKLNYAVTYACNARCTICNIWKTYVESPEKQKEELKLDEINTIFENFDLSWISLTGGEPFLRKDIHDIISVVNEKNTHLHLLSIPTNGSLPDVTVKTVEYTLEETDIPNVYITVSLDGDEEHHDSMRGMKGLWNKARKTYELLNTIEDERFRVFVEFTVSKYNAGHLVTALDSFGITDYSAVVVTAAHSSYYYCTDVKDLHEESSVTQVKKFASLCQFSSLEGLIPSLYIRLLEKYLQGDLPNRCVSGRSSFFLDPYGFLYPCISMDRTFGNLKESTLDELIHSEKGQNIIQKAKEGKCPGCWTPCEAYQSILENFPYFLASAYLK
jgi:MoaA/NifB/PqqE/SkfB family radical SAM enzyme